LDSNTQASASPIAKGERRTVVFIDYQNMYRSAREAFGWLSEPGHFGNFRPYGLGRQMVREVDRVLNEVRVYTGIHTPQQIIANGSTVTSYESDAALANGLWIGGIATTSTTNTFVPLAVIWASWN
jgi:hypothetical protein